MHRDETDMSPPILPGPDDVIITGMEPDSTPEGHLDKLTDDGTNNVRQCLLLCQKESVFSSLVH